MSDITRYERPAITADCVLFRVTELPAEGGTGEPQLQVRLVNRPNEPEQGKWALLGAFVPIDDRIEDVMRCAVLDKGGYGPGFKASQLHTFDTPGRDERWRVISVSYIGIVSKGQTPAKDAPDAEWFNVDMEGETLYQTELDLVIGIDDLAFDHGCILSMAIRRLLADIQVTDTALDFLDEPFQISDIKRVIETVTGKSSSNTQRTFSKFIERIDDKNGAVNAKNGTREKRPAHRPGILYKRKSE